MSRLFYDHNNRNCDILHSTYFNGLTYSERQKLAFNKAELAKLSESDRLLMRGYAQNIVERQKAFRYNHPNYNRTGTKRKKSSGKK